MTTRQAHQYAVLVQVRDYWEAQKAQIGDKGEVAKAFETVAGAVKEIDTHTKSKLHVRRDGSTTKAKVRAALRSQIGEIAALAKAMAKSVPDADARFPLPAQRSEVGLLQTGRLFVEEAAKVKDSFVACGMRPTFVEELQQAVVAFEAAIKERVTNKADSAVSHTAVREALKRGADAVRTLDVFMASALGRDVLATTAWTSIRRVTTVVKSRVALAAVETADAPAIPKAS